MKDYYKMDAFIEHCINNEFEDAQEVYDKNKENIDINDIYTTYTSEIVRSCNLFEYMCIKNHYKFLF
jgi:hypothetical protein